MLQTTSFEKFQKEKYIPNLDGLRGISILLVMLHHVPPINTPSLIPLQHNSRIGVPIFFAISGFLIARLALRELAVTGSFSIKNFYIRRSLRLFPLYYTVLAFICLLIFVFNVYPSDMKNQFAEKLPSYLFYYSNLAGPIGGPFSLLWSLAVEEQFYLLFSVLFLIFPTWVCLIIFLTLAALQSTMWAWIPIFNHNFTLTMAISLPGPIFLGVCLAYLFDKASFYDCFSYIFGNWYALSCLTLMLAFYLFVNGELIPIPEWMLNMVIALLVVTCAIFPPIALLENRFMSYVGKISYGLYLMHTIVFYGVKTYLSKESFVVFVIGGALAIGLASLSYEHYEKYFLNLKKKFRS